MTQADGAVPRGPPSFPRLPGYEVTGVLGRGGMGVVYRARQTALSRPVAIKMLLAGGYADPARLARFRAEAEAIGRLRHPNVVQVYDTGVHDGLPFFVMESVEGGRWPTGWEASPSRRGRRPGSPRRSPGPSRPPTGRGSSTAT